MMNKKDLAHPWARLTGKLKKTKEKNEGQKQNAVWIRPKSERGDTAKKKSKRFFDAAPLLPLRQQSLNH